MRLALILTLFSAVAHAAPQRDILRFTNADQLHGSFHGINPEGKLLWQRQDIPDPITLSTTDIRTVTLGTTTQAPSPDYSYISLKNGDILPGKIASLNDTAATLDSQVLGNIQIPRAHIASFCPQPYGGKIHYAGPFNKTGWDILDYAEPEEKTNNRRAAAKILVNGRQLVVPEDEEPPKPEKEKPKPKKKPAAWQHLGSAWYHIAGPDPLVRKDALPITSRLRFNIAWRNRLSLNLVLHADFMPKPEDEEEKDDDDKKAAKKKPVPAPQPMLFLNNGQQAQYGLYGNALILNIYQSYFILNRVGYDLDGNPVVQRMAHTPSSVQLPESGAADIEIRSDLSKGLIMLYINGQYAAQWENLIDLTGQRAAEPDPTTPMPLGKGLAFQCSSTTEMPVRITDIVIAEWNGIRDSAFSTIHEQRDIILLANGTDRYSGKLDSITNGTATFTTSLANLEIPITEIAEIHLATGAKDENPTEEETDTLTTRFFPIGHISGHATQADPTTMKLKHPLAGDLTLQLASAIAIDFSDQHSFLDHLDIDHQNPQLPENDE